MNKTLNSSMITLLFLFISISNVCGQAPWSFKFDFGLLSSYISDNVKDGYFQLECKAISDGTTTTSIWRSDQDGFKLSTGKATIAPFDIPARGYIFTEWNVEPTGAYFNCEIYLFEIIADSHDRLLGFAALPPEALETVPRSTKQYLQFTMPGDPFHTVVFDTTFWSEVKVYEGPWKIKLSTALLTNKMTQTFKGLYFKLKCYTIKDSISDESLVKYKSYEDGYAWKKEGSGDKAPTVKIPCAKFNLDPAGSGTGATAFTGWNIEPMDTSTRQSLYFYACDLYVATRSDVTGSETKWAVYPLPLKYANDFSVPRYMDLFKVEDVDQDRFQLEYQLLAEVQK